MTTATAKLARCRHRPSHLAPATCPSYGGRLDPAELPPVVLRHIVARIQSVLWLDGARWNPDKPWDGAADVLETIANTLIAHELRPGSNMADR